MDIQDIQKYCNVVFDPTDCVELRLIANDGRAEKLWAFAKDLLQHTATLEAKNRHGWNIYIGPNPRKGKGASGDSSVALCRCLFCDFDHIEKSDDITPTEVVLMKIEAAQIPLPAMVVSSGHGIHCYWSLRQPISPEQWKPVQERLNAALGSDPAIKNPERIMRLPGLKNVKAEPVSCFIVDVHDNSVYSLSEIEQWLPELPKPILSTKQPVQARAMEGKTKKARAILYAAKWQGCAEGERNSQAFYHAAQLLRDFALRSEDAWEILQSWNLSNNPPLDEKELRQILRDGGKYATGQIGAKLQKSFSKKHYSPTTVEQPANALTDTFGKIIDGRWQYINWPWTELSRLARSLLPGTLTILCGGIGASKTFMLLQAFAYWLCEGVKVALFELEENTPYYLSRILSQRAENANLTDIDWIKSNPAKSRTILNENTAFLDEAGKCISACPNYQPTLEQVGNWVEEKAKEGCRVICADPVTATMQTSEPWIYDNIFLQRIKRVAVENDASIILVTHGRKGANHLVDMDSLAGSSAYARFAQSILWLESHDKKESRVRTVCGRDDVEHNRTLHILKSRNGRGAGMRLAFYFDGDSLTLKEYGVIVKKK